MEKCSMLESGGTTLLDCSTSIKSEQNVAQKKGSCLLKISFALCWLPRLYAIFLGLSIIIPYCIAVSLGHVQPIFPSISEDGTTPPESCIFGQLLNLASFFAFATVLTRYKQVSSFYQDVPESVLEWNEMAFYYGTLADLGMSLVANFQETNIFLVHEIGASMLFVLGTTYEIIQSWISYKLTPKHCSLRTSRLRLFISITTVFFFLLYSLLDELAVFGRWLPEHLRCVFHDVANMCEWATAFTSIFFFLTFVQEFQKMALELKRRHRSLHAYEFLV